MNKKQHSLFEYMKQTLSLMEDNFLSFEFGNEILLKVEKDLRSAPLDYSQLKYIASSQEDYWLGVYLKDSQDTIDFFSYMMKKDWPMDNVFKKALENFLQLPKEIKKGFYEKNFFEIKELEGTAKTKSGEKIKVPFKLGAFCGNTYRGLNLQDDFFHNLPSLYLHANIHSFHKADESQFLNICKDIKEVLNIDHDQFLDKYGSAILVVTNIADIKKNWDFYQMDKRLEFKKLYALKYYKLPGKFKADLFLTDVEKNIVPYDIQTPSGERVMVKLLRNCLTSIAEAITENGFEKSKVISVIEEKNNLIKRLSNQYSFYFEIPKNLDELEDSMRKSMNDKFKDYPDVHNQFLDFMLTINNIKNPREVTDKKKIKI